MDTSIYDIGHFQLFFLGWVGLRLRFSLVSYNIYHVFRPHTINCSDINQANENRLSHLEPLGPIGRWRPPWPRTPLRSIRGPHFPRSTPAPQHQREIAGSDHIYAKMLPGRDFSFCWARAGQNQVQFSFFGHDFRNISSAINFVIIFRSFFNFIFSATIFFMLSCYPFRENPAWN